MIRVRRLASVTLETPDIQRQTTYYSEILGLSLVEHNDERAYLSGVNDHHSIILRQGGAPRCLEIGFQIAPQEDLEAFACQLSKVGVNVEMRSDPEPSIPKAVSFFDPKGTRINVFGEQKLSSQPYKNRGIVPVKLGHIAFNAPNVEGLATFYSDVLGFRLSDRIEDYFLFLRCGPDHHTVNFIESPAAKMHHLAFELVDWGHVQTACDFLGHSGYPLLWGPGRHVRGNNIFTYHRNPDHQIVELFIQLDQMHDEEIGYFEPRPWHATRPLKPQRWARNPRDTNLWGTLPPPGFMD